ncbi:MAG: hypothetical protein GF364_19010 [Candidatus Lokiarchaeota archaeon]|nr:hypothetical protein [Candidatus Lokiarchaeota archaeon]
MSYIGMHHSSGCPYINGRENSAYDSCPLYSILDRELRDICFLPKIHHNWNIDSHLFDNNILNKIVDEVAWIFVNSSRIASYNFHGYENKRRNAEKGIRTLELL